MTLTTLVEVEAEMKRLRQRIAALKLAVGPNHAYIPACSESAAVRRASMDLTRVLAKLRKG